MKKLHYSIQINAPKQKVWETMLNDETYRMWTSVFDENSRYEGTWTTGSDIKFFGPEQDGTISGMIGKIKEARPYDFVSVQYLGEINKGVETRFEQEAFENYTFNDKDGGTELLIDLDSDEKYADMFNDMWPKALHKLKELAEKK